MQSSLSSRPLPPLLAVTHNAYDTAAWEQLLDQANQQPIDQARPLYERFLTIYPLASRYWRQYILHEQSAHNYQQVEALFSRCLLSTLSLPLFQTYLDYVKHVKAGSDDYHDALTAAYDFTLQHVHLDLHSHTVFLAYVAVLATLPTSSPYEETQKLHRQRAVFQRAVLLPSVGVEDVWREWDKFEHSVNKQLAVQMLAEWNARHLQAKQVGKERRRRSRALRLDLLATPPSTATALLHSHQLLLWRSLIHYDMSNPMHLSPTDLYASVVFTYRQALCHLSHEPVLQLEYLQYVGLSAAQLGGLGEDVERRWKESVEVMAYSVLWRQCYTEWLEQQGRVKEVREVYERWLDDRNKRKKDAADREEEGREEVKRRIAKIETGSSSTSGGEGEEKKEDESAATSATDAEDERLRLAEQDEDDEAAARSQLHYTYRLLCHILVSTASIYIPLTHLIVLMSVLPQILLSFTSSSSASLDAAKAQTQHGQPSAHTQTAHHGRHRNMHSQSLTHGQSHQPRFFSSCVLFGAVKSSWSHVSTSV